MHHVCQISLRQRRQAKFLQVLIVLGRCLPNRLLDFDQLPVRRRQVDLFLGSAVLT